MNTQTAYFASGCFWCVEAIFQRLDGVISVHSGYCNGTQKNPTYQDICTGLTGHAEVIKVVFDADIIDYAQLLVVFFKTHDATTLNQQGADRGTQYRSGIFYLNQDQHDQANSYIASLPNADKITTQVAALDVFYQAETYHQNYFNNNPNNPYCLGVIAPKLAKYFQL